MAVKKKKPAVRKPVKKGTKSFSQSGIFYGIFFVFAVLVVLYSQRNVLAYYLGFKTDKIVYAESRMVPLDKVLDTHIEKSFGIDISEYQDEIDWEQLKELEGGYPIEFVFIRATVGNDRADRKFKKYWKKAKQKKFICGAYHYYRPNENSVEQANNFIENVTLVEGDFPPVLDIEKLPKEQSIERLKVGLKRWLSIVEKHYGVKPIIYSSESYYVDFLRDDFEEYPFWIANYTSVYEDIDDEWSIWQISESAKADGIKGCVDANIYNGTSVGLKEILIK
ncbi:glycoside hydrolase family 25 protein [Flavobacterium humi]|uniref:Glycoside hydrolase family 25 protein n=1 Tax=Flavobacterium humi TaxID=2562683 RepID=A0A4Z0L7P9_9FLAO|nr:glycoside hydrolase family 25 protein [Flavobacterium humi]TGD57176.1 glycoside hydrolase family 25 protein [Flavobacterium humi]